MELGKVVAVLSAHIVLELGEPNAVALDSATGKLAHRKIGTIPLEASGG
jgi:hypothetical protein